ncbi:MAG: DsbA family protein [Alphaproteobacteria bacterium]
MPNRRDFLLLLGASAFLVVPFRKTSATMAPELGEMVLGEEDAPVTVIEYFSLTCEHCMRVHQDVFPQVEESYIGTGKIRFVARDFPLNDPALRAAMVARCLGRERYFGFIAALFDNFDHWTGADDPMRALALLAAQSEGMSREDFDACVANTELETTVLTSYLTGMTEHEVSGTPTFIINGRKFEDVTSFEKFEKIVEPILSGM